MATASERLDILVKDYLLFRGFTATVKALDYELKQDKDKGLRADRILEQLLAYVGTYDLQHLRDNWAYLNQRFFSRLEQRYSLSVRKLEVSLLKLYVVNAQQNNRQDRVRDFFDKMGPELQNQPEFRDWFAFPFLPNPADNSTFALYFTKQWQETLQLSLHNFLQVVLQAMPVPTLLNFDHDYRHMLALQEENELLKNQMHSIAGGTLADKHVSVGKPSKVSAPQPLPDLIYDFSGLAEETDSLNEKQKPARRFPINLSAPLLKRKQESRADKSKASSFSNTPPHTKSTNQNANNSAARGASQSTSRRPSRQSFNTTVTTTGTTMSRTSTGSVPHASSTAATTSVGGKAAGSRDGPSRPVSETTVVGGVRSKVARELISFPPYFSPESERADLLLVQGSGGAGMVGKPDVSVDHSAASTATKQPGTSEQGATEEDSAPTCTSQAAEPAEFKDGEKLPELQAGEQCPFLLLSEDDYLEHQSAVVYSRFSASGQHIASLDADGVVKVWTWSPQPSTTATVMSRAPYLSLDWASKSDRWLLLGNRSGQIRLFDMRDSKTFREASVEPPYTRVTFLSSCTATMMFASCQSAAIPAGSVAVNVGHLSLWDLRTMKLEKNLTTDPVGVASTCCTHNSTGKLLLAGGADGIVRLYDVVQQQCVLSWPAHRGPVTCLHFGAQDASCFSMGTDRKLCEWSLTQSGQAIRQVEMNVGASQQSTAPVGEQGQVFCLNKDKTFLLSSSASRGLICKVSESSDRPSLTRIMELNQHDNIVTTVDWSPSAETPVCSTGARDGCLKVYTLLSQ